ncbi:MAG: hypothetical protein ACR2P1_06200 [Pseudomonadales bacterium]
MITGHLATTLVAKRETPHAPWWLLIVAAFLIDIAMFTLVGLGIEQMEPAPNADGPTMSSAIVEMTYSHDLLPQLFWISLSGVLAYVFTRNGKIVIIAMLLTLGHWLGDLISGYGHFVFGPESAALGTDWYHKNLLAALVFEAVLGAACVYWFVRNQGYSLVAKTGLFVGFAMTPFVFLLF